MNFRSFRSALEIATNLAVLIAALLVIGLASASLVRRKPAVAAETGAVPMPERVPSVEMQAGDAPALGASTAAVTIVEFSDFECPFCDRIARTLRYQVLPGEGAQVRLVFRHFPLLNHTWATPAAEISECVAMQSTAAFWSLHDFFFQNQLRMNPGTLHDEATAFLSKNTRIDVARMNACVDSGLAKPRIRADVALGRKYGVHSTPTLFLNGLRITGAPSAERLQSLIQAELNAVGRR